MSSQYRPKTPTKEQLDVLASGARITVVRACPGAGKTEVFVEAIRQKLARWERPEAGLAALSFTNIARDTIESRVGGAVQHPHFVGTLDAFVFRFIVKPFGHLVNLPAGKVRLFPAAISDHLDEPAISVGKKRHERASIFSVHFCGLNGKKPAIATRLQKIGRFEVDAEMIDVVLDQKRRFWKSTGIVTHSDCHFLASSIVRHPDYGAQVRGLITKRFPVICIDELQDTGCFLARSFLALFGEAALSGLVVGDPDQAIYGFGGASPAIFEDFEGLPGAVSLTLRKSQRCAKSISCLVSTFSASGAAVESTDDANEGKATLLIHALDDARLSPLQSKNIRELATGASFAVITRNGKTARALKGDKIRDEFRGKSKSARRINTAVQRLLSREPREAAQIVERELCRVVFGDERAIPSEIGTHRASSAEWRAAIFGVLQIAVQNVQAETWNEWVERVKEAVRLASISLGWVEERKSLLSYKKCNNHGTQQRVPLLDVDVATLWESNDTITTIHKVKGTEFDTVVLFSRKPHMSHAPCPSKEWWSDVEDSEEKRIAFVAISRAKLHFVFCVHKTTYEALKLERPEFLKLFTETISLPV